MTVNVKINEDNTSKVKELRDKLLTRKEVGEVFGVGEDTIYRWERLNPNWIKPVKIGKYVGYRVEDVEAYLAGKYKASEDKEK